MTPPDGYGLALHVEHAPTLRATVAMPEVLENRK
jgi:hypothetical protein